MAILICQALILFVFGEAGVYRLFCMCESKTLMITVISLFVPLLNGYAELITQIAAVV